MSARPYAAQLAAALAASSLGLGIAQGLPAPPDAQPAPAVPPAPPAAATGFGTPPPAPAPLPGRAWRIEPSVHLGGTWSDNVALQSDAAASAGWLTTVRPRIRVEHAGPRASVTLDYRHERSLYSDRSEFDNSRNYMNGAMKLELLERWLFLDGLATITQISRNAFGEGVVLEAPNANRNQVEARTASLSPHARGRIGDLVQWTVRYNETSTRTDSEGAASVRTSEVVGGARSAAPAARLGWTLDASALRTRSDAFGSLQDNRVRAGVVIGVAPHLHLSLYEGYEETDFGGQGDDRGHTPGAGLEWSPSPRTQVAAIVERRFFGTGYIATLSHRTPRTAWRLESRRESTLLSSVLGAAAGTLDRLLGDLLAASISDPFARGAAVRRRLDELGTAPTSIGTAFLTERPFLVEGLDASFAYRAPRSTLTVGFTHRDQRALGAPGSFVDSFDLAGGEIQQRGGSVSWQHRLTRLTSLTLAGSMLESDGEGTQARRSRHELATLFLTTQLSPNTTATFGARRVDFRSNAATSYRENALFGSITYRP